MVPAAVAAAGGAVAGNGETSGSGIIALRYASAEDLAKVLQPFAGTAGSLLLVNATSQAGSFTNFATRAAGGFAEFDGGMGSLPAPSPCP